MEWNLRELRVLDTAVALSTEAYARPPQRVPRMPAWVASLWPTKLDRLGLDWDGSELGSVPVKKVKPSQKLEPECVAVAAYCIAVEEAVEAVDNRSVARSISARRGAPGEQRYRKAYIVMQRVCGGLSGRAVLGRV